MGYDLGVDIGGTAVAAATASGSGVELIDLGDRAAVLPAVIFLADDGNLITGEAALRLGAEHPDRVTRELRRRLGDPTPVRLGDTSFGVPTLLGALLCDVVDRVSETLGSKPDRVTLAHPAHWSPARRAALTEAIRHAGIPEVRTVTEPEAVAAHYAADGRIDDGRIVAVYDLGGGTFDATVLRRDGDQVEILGEPEAIERLGGGAFDEALLAAVNKAAGGPLTGLDRRDPQNVAAVARLRQECARAKETLSADMAVTIPVQLPNRAVDVRLTRAEFEELIRSSIETTIVALLHALQSAGVEPGELDSVLLVGGCARIPLVARMVTAALARPTVLDAHPKFPVALGAARLSGAAPATAEREPAADDQGADGAPTPTAVGVGATGATRATADRRAPAPVADPFSLFDPVIPADPPAPVTTEIPLLLRAAAPATTAAPSEAGARGGTEAATTTRALATAPVVDKAAAAAPAPAAPAGRPSPPSLFTESTPRPEPESEEATGRFLDVSAAQLTRSALAEAPPIARPIGPPAGPPAPAAPGIPARRRIGIIAAAALVLLALLAGLGYLITGPLSAPGVTARAGAPADPAAPAPDQPPAAPVASGPRPVVTATVPVGKTPGFVVVAPDGRAAMIANQAAGVLTVVDTASNEVTATIPVPAGPPQYLSFAPDGRRVYVSIWNQARTVAAVGVLDTSSNRFLATIPVRTRPYLSAVTPDGSRLYVPNHDSGTVSVIDTGSLTVISEIKVAPNPHWVEMSRDGRRLYTANHESNLVSVIDIADDNILAEIRVGISPHSVAAHPTRPLIANVNYDAASVTMINTDTDAVVATIPVGKNPQDITWAADGKHAYVVNSGDNTLSVIDAGSRKVTATIPTGASPSSVSVLPSGAAAYVSNLGDGTVSVLDITR